MTPLRLPSVRSRLALRLGILLTWLALAALPACTAVSANRTGELLRPCTSEEGPADALCGTLTVFEDRDSRTGRRIDLWIVVLPSLSAVAEEDPLVFLAGGPGQGAAQLAPQVQQIFRRVLRRRDIVLVDQRGTGKSHPLDCRAESNSLQEMTQGGSAALDRLRTCLDGYDADVRLYTTDIAMDDLEDVLDRLGYGQVNLYGGSYGTRAALVYLRQHGERVRSVVLDGVAPVDMRLPLYTARDAQRALDRLLLDCESDAPCQRTFPGLAARVRTLLSRLESRPAQVRIAHPRTGVPEEVTVDARVVANVLFSALYSPVTASILPALVDRAERGEFQSLFALALANDGAGARMSVGMQLSVLCSEDASRVSTEELVRETSMSLFASTLLGTQLEACAIWPTRRMDADYYKPVVSDVPTLVLSGDLDPVTPPGWGESVVRHLSRGRHIAVPATGHGVVNTPCGNQLVTAFLERASTDELDIDCVASVRRPPFFLSPAGPDPAPGELGHP